MIDPEYMRLYRRYVKALKAYEITLKKRRAARARWKERKKQPPAPRRPMGALAGFRISPTPSVKSGRGYKPQEMKVYMGKILGGAGMPVERRTIL